MSYTDEPDDREAERADMAALLGEDGPDCEPATWCDKHGWQW